MLKTIPVTAAALFFAANVAVAAPGANVRVSAPPPPNVNIQIGAPAPPPVRVVERERVVVHEKSDNGKHKGHYKAKKHKKHKNK